MSQIGLSPQVGVKTKKKYLKPPTRWDIKDNLVKQTKKHFASAVDMGFPPFHGRFSQKHKSQRWVLNRKGLDLSLANSSVKI